MPAHAQQAVGDGIRLLPCCTVVHDPLGDPPEVLDEHDPQGNRYRPKLADRQRLDLLIRPHVSAQHLEVEAAVGVGDEGPRGAEHPRIPGEWPDGELR